LAGLLSVSRVRGRGRPGARTGGGTRAEVDTGLSTLGGCNPITCGRSLQGTRSDCYPAYKNSYVPDRTAPPTWPSTYWDVDPRPTPAATPKPQRSTEFIQQHLETYLTLAREDNWDGQAMPAFGERECRHYLECGILDYGFARARAEPVITTSWLPSLARGAASALLQRPAHGRNHRASC
jgi:hypothetical protein